MRPHKYCNAPALKKLRNMFVLKNAMRVFEVSALIALAVAIIAESNYCGSWIFLLNAFLFSSTKFSYYLTKSLDLELLAESAK